MKDEIKQILLDLEFASGVFDYTITPDRCTFLKYYITNLQEKNERLNNIIDELEKWLKEENYKNEDFWCINSVEVLNKLKQLKQFK